MGGRLVGEPMDGHRRRPDLCEAELSNPRFRTINNDRIRDRRHRQPRAVARGTKLDVHRLDAIPRRERHLCLRCVHPGKPPTHAIERKAHHARKLKVTRGEGQRHALMGGQ